MKSRSMSGTAGNLAQLMLSRTYGDPEFEWQKQYGPVYRIKGCFGVRLGQLHGFSTVKPSLFIFSKTASSFPTPDLSNSF
jgi:hypothetical protein